MVGDRMIQLQHRVNYRLVGFPLVRVALGPGLSCGWSAGSGCPWKEERLERQARPEWDLETKQRIRAPQNLESTTNLTSQAEQLGTMCRMRRKERSTRLCLCASGFEYMQIIDQ
jgi:hypothetical protein